jgi:hypothetical protein
MRDKNRYLLWNRTSDRGKYVTEKLQKWTGSDTLQLLDNWYLPSLQVLRQSLLVRLVNTVYTEVKAGMTERIYGGSSEIQYI